MEALPPPPPPPEKWGVTPGGRNEQSRRYAEQLKLHFSVGEHKLEVEERRARHESVVRAAFAGCRGAPEDVQLWSVTASQEEGGVKYKYSHPDFENECVYTALAPLVRDLGFAVYEASTAPGQDSQNLLGVPSADSLPTLPENLDATRALEQVQRIVAADGATQPLRQGALRMLASHALARRCTRAVWREGGRRVQPTRSHFGHNARLSNGRGRGRGNP